MSCFWAVLLGPEQDLLKHTKPSMAVMIPSTSVKHKRYMPIENQWRPKYFVPRATQYLHTTPLGLAKTKECKQYFPRSKRPRSILLDSWNNEHIVNSDTDRHLHRIPTPFQVSP